MSETTRIYQAINSNSIRIEEINSRLDKIFGERIDEITPYTETKTAYIEDTEITFTDVPNGNLTVSMVDAEGNYPEYTVSRSGDRVTVNFEPLNKVATVTINVL